MKTDTSDTVMTSVKTEPADEARAVQAGSRPKPMYAQSVPPPPMVAHGLTTVWQLSIDSLIHASEDLISRYSDEERGSAMARIYAIQFQDSRQKEAAIRRLAPQVMQLSSASSSSPPQGA